MKTIEELLEIVLHTIEDYFAHGTKGICGVIDDLNRDGIVSMSEYNEIHTYIHKNMPQDFIAFGWTDPAVWGWKPGDVEPRIKWLKEHLELQGKIQDKVEITFNLRLGYDKAMDCAEKIRELGGDGNITVGGSWYIGTKDQIQELITYMAKKHYDLDSMSFGNDPKEATKRQIEQLKEEGKI